MQSFKIPALIAVIGLMVGGCVTKSTYLKQVNTVEQMKAQQKALDAQIDALNGQIKSLNQNIASAKSDNDKLMAALEAKKGELNQRVADLSKENQDLTQKLRETEQAKTAEIDQMKNNYDQLVSGLKDQIQAGQIQITQLAGRLSVNMVDKILFNSGEANVKADGQKVLQQVGQALKNIHDKAIRVEGHTDNVPISASLRDKFASNWELSTARATAVVRYLQDQVGLAPDRLIAAGYGEYHPIASNDTPEGRQQNRRIEIVLVPVETVAVSTPTVAH